MNTTIIHIDMHIRDERVLAYISSHVNARGEIKISHEQIAKEFSCHRNTAAAIIWRLASAGLIEIDRSAKRGGYIYRLPKKAS